MKRILLILSVAMMTQIGYGATFASGQCGDNLYWEIDNDNWELKIYGTGPMNDFANRNTPWIGYNGLIKSIVIKEGVTHIGNQAFAYLLSNIGTNRTVTIPNSVQTMGERVFENSGAETLILGTGITAIDELAFYLSIISTVYWNCNNYAVNYNSATGNRSPFFNNDEITKLYVGDNVTYLTDELFCYMSKLRTLELPNTITDLGRRTFYRSDALKSITIPDNVEELKEQVFGDCKRLYKVNLNKIKKIGNEVFASCIALTEIKIPESVTYIAPAAFDNCTALRKITWNAANCSIDKGHNPFATSKGDTNIAKQITTFEFGDAVETLPERICEGTSITKVSLPSKLKTVPAHAFNGCSSLQRVNVGSNVKTIAEYAFEGCGVETVTLPDGLDMIGYAAFIDCANLTTINIPSKLRVIDSGAFFNCSRLTSFSAPSTLTMIGNSAFADCTSLNSLTLNNGLQFIYDHAFDGCTQLSGMLTIPSSVVQLGSYAFHDCGYTMLLYGATNCADGASAAVFDRKMTNVTISANVTTIPSYLCAGLTGITEITIPSKVHYIGMSAFKGCTGLQTINAEPTTPPTLGVGVFSNIRSDLTSITLNTPDDGKYRLASGWASFFDPNYSSYSLVVSSNDNELGTAYIDLDGSEVGSVEYLYGSSYSLDLYAEAKDEAVFINWTKDGEVYSTEKEIHISSDFVVADDEYVANFMKIARSDFENGILPGLFSVSDDEQVQFSQGNLQHIGDSWAFAAAQYSYAGEAGLDLLNWSADYGLTEAIENGGNEKGLWRMLTSDEWIYLFEDRRNADYLSGPALVGTANGYVILPDQWTLPAGLSFNANATRTSDNTYTFEQWQQMEAAGAVFLPCAGMASETGEANSVNFSGNYWAADLYDDYAYCFGYMYADDAPQTNVVSPTNYYLSVRLVKNNHPVTALPAIESRPVENTARKIMKNGIIYIQFGSRLYNLLGIEVK